MVFVGNFGMVKMKIILNNCRVLDVFENFVDTNRRALGMLTFRIIAVSTTDCRRRKLMHTVFVILLMGS